MPFVLSVKNRKDDTFDYFKTDGMPLFGLAPTE
jgi:hypothetical protein